jgi:ATP-dependent phosphofructokinase / diphosphate-dependent phosphofructokinase
MVSCTRATNIFTLSDMTSHKRIGILTSGGDCAGLNAAIRAVVHRAIDTYNWEPIGIFRATQGLMERPFA